MANQRPRQPEPLQDRLSMAPLIGVISGLSAIPVVRLVGPRLGMSSGQVTVGMILASICLLGSALYARVQLRRWKQQH